MQRRKHNVLEVSGRDVEEAIANGLAQLGISRDEVLIEVLNRGRRRLFGLGSEAAQVRILYPAEEEEVSQIADEPVPPPSQEVPQIDEEEQVESDFVVSEAEPEEAPLSVSAEELPQIAQATVKELLERMGIQAQVIVHEPQEDQLLTLDISGEDLGILIGPRGETLNALQYIARLITSRELLHWATFFLDVEGYRQRRAKELQDLVHRMAERVALNRQPLALEPMPAHERRIIHIALRDHPLAATESVGQGEHRRVTILPRE
jgi:spoIIIJ-associated protein